ncbi:class I SAM-dependent methyltransferase [Luteimonas sp. MJ250]|uniref:class I SAM-dependent methyltransferase n=1 Tax=Luteimonas sp. MJ250 TaxID=3129236 RepID=UPI0031BBA338
MRSGTMYYDAYSRQEIVDDFASRDYLTPAEFAALGEVWPLVRGDVLDVGVGGGRTTGYLQGVARTYRALDISENMAAACRALYPDADVSVGDARSLAAYPDGSFDLVLFSFNGIDYIDHTDRKQVLAAAYRVLRPGGAFVYSSHNLAVLEGRLPPVAPARIVPTIDPLRMLVRSVRTLATGLRRRRNRRRLQDRQYLAGDHAVVNDEGYDHSLLTVYVDPAAECEALSAAGFVDTVTIDARGRRDPARHLDPWVYYVTRKAAVRSGR